MNEYVVNTFVSQKESNYKTAIRFYQQKTEALIALLQRDALSAVKKTIDSVDDVNSLFNKAVDNVSRKLQGNIEPLMTTNISGAELQERIAQWNEATGAVTEGIQNGFDTVQFINTISSGKANIKDPTELPQLVDMSAQRTALTKLANRGYEQASAAGGARALIMGEFMEQMTLGLTQEELGGLFNFITQTGFLKTKNLSGVSSGKSDIMFGVDKIEFVDATDGNKNYSKGKLNGEVFELDIEEAVDLENTNIDSLIQKYTSGSRATIGGITIKQWADKAIGSSAATFAHSAYTAQLINDRWPPGITQEFEDRDTFKNYTAYVISRFMINIIGVYNTFVANSTSFEPTYKWIQMLLNKKYQLEHVIQLQNGIYKAKVSGGNTIQVGKEGKQK